MAEIEFDCPGIIHGGTYDGWTITIEKALDDPSFMCAFLKAPNSTEKYDHFLEDGIDVIIEDFVANCDIEWQLDKKLQISEERQKENKVIGWWVRNLPQSQKVFGMMTEGYDPTESVGIYVLIGSLILEFYDKPLKAHNGKELKKFLELYNRFIEEFKGIFLENNGKKLAKNPKAQDSVIAMVSTEMGEGTDPEDYDYVINLMPEGMLKEEFKNFVNWAKNN